MTFEDPQDERRLLHTADGVELDAVHLPAQGERRLGVVVAHGFSGSWRRPAVDAVSRRLVQAAHTGVVGFDFRGHGRSGGESTLGDAEVLDLDAAVRWARELDYARVATLGFSMGGSVAVRHAALQGGVDGVVTVSGPSRWYYRGTKAMRRLHWLIETRPGRAVAKRALGTRVSDAGWDPVPEPPTSCAARLAPTPFLVVHGDRDDYFPLEHAEALAAAAGEHAELWIEPGFGHGVSAIEPALVDRILAWLHDAVDTPR